MQTIHMGWDVFKIRMRKMQAAESAELRVSTRAGKILGRSMQIKKIIVIYPEKWDTDEDLVKWMEIGLVSLCFGGQTRQDAASAKAGDLWGESPFKMERREIEFWGPQQKLQE